MTGQPTQVAGTGKLPQGLLIRARYLIIRKIAQGGHGAVYLVEDTQAAGNKRFALKQMSLTAFEPHERADAIASFRREAGLLMKLNHPNLVKVHEQFTENGQEYLVMSYVDGSTLEDKASMSPKGVMTQKDVLAYALQLCHVLARCRPCAGCRCCANSIRDG